MNQTAETARVDAIAQNSLYAVGVNPDTIRYSFRIFSRFMQPGPVLEMGPAEGVMTELLYASGQALSVVEGSPTFADAIRRRFPNANVSCALFEEFSPNRRFESIVLGHVLEHVESPVAILERASEWLTPTGRIYAAVPNAHSIHRQAAVLMGLLPTESTLNDLDRHHGHRRVYTPPEFARDFREAGLQVEISGGYWLKPVSNKQIEQTWSPEMLEAFMRLGEQYPDIAGEIYVVAGKASGGR